MILGLIGATALCLWLITVGLFQRVPEPLLPSQTYLSSSGKNYTVIFVVLDAFRYDYSQRFHFFNRTLEQHPKNSILLKMFSSAPTMTTQKLQVMMSGHQLSSKNIIQNFMAETTTEDNILKYVETVCMGDDTWSRLYKVRKSIDCQSFVVADLHSCDRMVIDNLITEYKSGKYQMVIGHFLGLDHIGHTFSSVSTAQTTYKLNEISGFLDKVVEAMDDRTVLLVLGDHGMKSDGNHGGSSKEQIETVLFAYSKAELMQEQPRSICFQNDLTSTLSVLLNTPLPINSLGNIVFSAVPKSLDLNITEAAQKLKTHTGRVLKRLEIEYQWGKEIEVGRQVKARINEYYILATIVVLGSVLGYMATRLKLTRLEIVFLGIYPLTSFSWFLLRHQQSYLQLFLILVFLSLTIKSQKASIFIDSMLTIFLLCQFQPHRKDEFNNSLLHLDFLSYFLQHPYVLMTIKLILLSIRTSNLRKLSYLQIFSKVLIFLNIIVCQVSEQLLCVVRSVHFGLLVVMLFLRQENRASILQGLILIFSGKKGMVMFALSDTLKLNLDQSGVLLPYLNYYISEAIWLGKGNRADFSTIDVRPSYIFTTHFIPLLNFVCLTIHQMCSYLHYLQQLQLSTRLQHVIDQNQNQIQKQAVEVVVGWQAHLRYLMVPAVGTLFSLVCLYLNIGKILFTVVYIPLCFFCTLKLATLLVFVGVRYICTRYRILG